MRKLRIKTHIVLLAGILGILISQSILAQGANTYTNQWIKKGQSYLKFDIKAKGLYKIPFSVLPVDFDIKDPNKIQLFYRGEQISIISTDNKEILFYGIGNDGSRDSLLYRPMSSRINPYTSLFSDKAAYFLTVGDTNGLRSKQQGAIGSESIRPQGYHFAEELKIYDSEYSLSTYQSIYPSFSNSFYEKGASKTGAWIVRDTLMISKVQLSHVNRNSSVIPNLELFIHGRSNNARQIDIFVGKDSSSLRKLTTVDIQGFMAGKINENIRMDDIREDGNLFIAYKSLSNERLERYSIAYYKVRYAQNLDMNLNKSKLFTFRSNGNEVIGVNVNNVPASAAVYDITNVANPVIIKRNLSNTFDYKSDGPNDKKIYITNEVVALTAPQIAKVSFPEIDPKLYNYIVISTDPLKEGAMPYANYRSSKEGGGHSVLYTSIKDIYNQFNYGEVSPLGIRSFIDYMLSDGNRNKQLFIIGKSISFFERKVADLEGDVPTVGFPGSDVLLVAGLAGAKTDEPAIPVGRISVTTISQISDYLDKVKQYEHDSNGDQGWKKNVLHINGGHSVGEITNFKNEFENFAKYVTNGTFGGKVTPFVKKGLIEVEDVDITPEVNEGVGMISYMGHGSQFITDVNFGYASLVSRGYRNVGKYPLLYFNGCGVGNIFNGRLNTNLNAGDRMPLSLDWLLSKEKGAIAIIANSFESFTSPSVKYLDYLYKNLFSDKDQEVLTIGQIQQNAVVELLTAGANTYDIGNIHQSILQGDPALKLIRVGKPDYAMNSSNAITIFADNAGTIDDSDSLRLQIVVKNGGRFMEGQSIPVVIEELLENKVINSFSRLIPSYKLQDTLFIKFPNLGRKINQFRVVIDPENKVSEITKENNTSVLDIDWTLAGSETIYPIMNLVDIYPPILDVNFNNHYIESGQVVKENPQINLQISDDRILEPDLNLIEIYIKNCDDESCDYVKIQDNLSIIKSTNKSFVVQYSPSDIGTGIYELLVNIKDLAGNTPSSPYRLQFRVQDEDLGTKEQVSVLVSPNPTSSYVKFQIKSDMSQFDNVQIEVYNMNGILIYSKNLVDSKDGAYQWYWSPTVTSGTYVYKISFRTDTQELKNISSRVVIIK